MYISTSTGTATQSLEAIRNSPDIPAPNFVLDTSPGKHQVVWKVTGFEPEEAEALLRDLSNQFDGDPAATDSTRVLRLPGFANRKLSEEFIVQARHESKAVHTPRDFALQEGSPETPRHIGEGQERPRTMPTDHKSQSERDWAIRETRPCPRRRPEEIIRRIADYRADEKSDPGILRASHGREGTTKICRAEQEFTAIEQDRPDEAQREVP